jgi:murein DD-endopeptidase MepM/ murein hydrolase activator NlpD
LLLHASASSALPAEHDTAGGETAVRLAPDRVAPDRAAPTRAGRSVARMSLDAIPAAGALPTVPIAHTTASTPTLAQAAANLISRQQAAQQAAQRAAKAAATAKAAFAAAKAEHARIAKLHSWVRPNDGALSSPFAMRWGRMHKGIDLAGGYGSPIFAAAGGTVAYAGAESGYGRVVKIVDWDGTQTWYGHMSQFLVNGGDHVTPGQEIALVGAAGDATGPHLHFEVRVDGAPVDPIPFLAARGVHV